MNVQENVKVENMNDEERKARMVLLTLLDRAILDNKIHQKIDYDEVVKNGVPALLKMKEMNSFEFFK